MGRKIFLAFPSVLLIVLSVQTGIAAELRRWNVDGISREALVVAPTQPVKGKLPLLFVFHGHGGNMHLAEQGQEFHESWPEAIVVYPQGLPTAGYLGDTQRPSRPVEK